MDRRADEADLAAKAGTEDVCLSRESYGQD